MPADWLDDLAGKVAAMTFASDEYPWIATAIGDKEVQITCYGDGLLGTIHADEDDTDPNREFGNDAAGIVALRNEAPRLIEIARAARAYVAACEKSRTIEAGMVAMGAYGALAKTLEDK